MTSSNEGIQGTNIRIKAKALAVGSHATANSTDGSPSPGLPAMSEAVEQLSRAIEALELKAAAREALREDVKRLTEVAKEPEPDRDRVGALLAGITGKLAAFGVLLTQTAGLAEPIKKIADLVKFSLGALGL